MAEADTFDLERFVTAQQPVFETALEELKAGRKRSHWMWFVFPQLRGLGSSSTSVLSPCRSAPSTHPRYRPFSNIKRLRQPGPWLPELSPPRDGSGSIQWLIPAIRHPHLGGALSGDRSFINPPIRARHVQLANLMQFEPLSDDAGGKASRLHAKEIGTVRLLTCGSSPT